MIINVFVALRPPQSLEQLIATNMKRVESESAKGRRCLAVQNPGRETTRQSNREFSSP